MVLYDEQGKLAVAVECKEGRYINPRIVDQLEEYFRDTNAQFGLLANDTRPSKWTIWELGDEMNKITLSQFEEGLVKFGSS